MKKCNQCGSLAADNCSSCALCGAAFQSQPPATQPLVGAPPVYQYPKPIKTRRPDSPRISVLNVLYSLLLFFLIFPIIIPSFTSERFGYGVRQQIGAFNDLANNADSVFGKVLILSAVITMVISAIIAVAFTIVSFIYVNSAQKKGGINKKVLKIYSFVICGAVVLIALLSCAWLTFTFMCAAVCTAFIMLLTLKPRFAYDLLHGKDNHNNHTNALMLLLYALALVVCFAPVLRADNTFGSPESYNIFQMATKPAAESELMCVGGIIVISFAFLSVAYLMINYVREMKIPALLFNAVVIMQLILIVLIGTSAFISFIDYSMRIMYYVLAALLISNMIISSIYRRIEND